MTCRYIIYDNIW